MKLAIMQPYFFPYLGYFQLINTVDKFLLYDLVDFQKKSWMTRNRILIKNVGPVFIQVPVKRQSTHAKISEVRIGNTDAWKKRLIKTLYFAYKGSSYFRIVFPIIEKLIETDSDYLHEYNSIAIKNLCKILEISTVVESDNSKYLELEKNLFQYYDTENNLEDQNISKRRHERIFSIAREEKANTYINPIGGTLLYDKGKFAEKDIDLFFVKTKKYFYNQNTENFSPDLSIIDVLFNCGLKQTKELLNNYELI